MQSCYIGLLCGSYVHYIFNITGEENNWYTWSPAKNNLEACVIPGAYEPQGVSDKHIHPVLNHTSIS